MNVPASSAADVALIRQALGLTEAFASWPAPLLDRLLPMSRLGRHPRGALVHSEAEAEPEILTVVSGHLMVSRVNIDGSRASISVLGPGLVIGIPRGMNPDDEALYDYRANDDAVVVHVPARIVFQTLDSEAFLWKTMAHMLLKQHRQMLTTVVDQLAGNLRRRLAATIDRLAQIYGVDSRQMSLRLRLSQDDLAAMLQVSRGALNREIRMFEEQGLIRAEYGTLIVLDLPSLRKLAGSVEELGQDEEQA
ncbi:Crp/Fnr family transcriptional regulator [Variovorax sp. KBW07]|uniref:Crp/Fnr family transcriptional regulator n=1 Tax=Variovorax sp. KBW07 TaxID=2153358 RepID=UPI000F58427A|nr:Crp/Fnr family transcriptional regulator [Variovorax sp. KBW07]